MSDNRLLEGLQVLRTAHTRFLNIRDNYTDNQIVAHIISGVVHVDTKQTLLNLGWAQLSETEFGYSPENAT